MKGTFIVIEGIEGAGKSTQVKKLANRLTNEGYKVITVREPGGTPLGEKVRKILLRSKFSISPLSELYLYLSARVQLVEDVIKPALKNGTIVIADRFIHSTIAYQGYGRGLDIKTVERLAISSTCGIMPDITILLDIPVEKGLQRTKGVDRFSSMTPSFHKKVRKGYLITAGKKNLRMKIVNAEEDMEKVAKEILLEVKRIL